MHHGRGQAADGVHAFDFPELLVQQHHGAGGVGRGLVVGVQAGAFVPAEVVGRGRAATREAGDAVVVDDGEVRDGFVRAGHAVVG